MKKIIYISLLFALGILGCKKAEKVATYQVSLGEVVITSGINNVNVCATYTYEYTLKSVKFMYSDSESLDDAMVNDADFANGTVTVTADGLQPNTTYFYKFEFYNGISKMWSDVRNFRTLDEPVVTELVVNTAEVTGILETSAVCGGEVVSEGSSPVIARGVCYGLEENPTIGNCIDTTMNGSGLGTFVSQMTGLERETKYYVRAYATDSDTTCYGGQKAFTTLKEIVYSLPTVITNNVDEQGLGQYNALLSGNVTDDGNMPITGCGFWYSTEHDTLGGFTKPATYNTGGFNLNVTDGIEPGTTYYARAYAENALGRRFGNEVSFTTLSLPPTPDPQAFTLPSSDVTMNSAKIKGRIYYDGTENPIKKGFVYGLDVNDLNNDIDCTSQSDPFEAVLSGLTPNTTYYYKAYAQYASYAQTFYGSAESFTTLIEIVEPTIHTVNPSNITTTSANSGGYGITDGNSPVTVKGVCWATSDNPTLESSLGYTEDGSGTDDFTSVVTGLASNTSYYVRAYAKNQAGKVGYGESLGFVTMIMHQAPDVTTNQASGISGNGATLGGSVTNDYNSNITECWIMWGEGDDAMTNRLDCNAGMTFSGTLTNLQNNQTYSFQAFAKNEFNETGNGDIQQFTTNNEIPDVETLDATAITANSATMNGRVNDDHGINITECWIMWGRSASSMNNRLDCTAGADFNATVDTLQPNTTYYFNAYAKNANGQEGNGTVKQLLTLPTLPTVTTAEVTGITQTAATGGGNVTNDGGATVTACGICWNTSQNPTIANSHTTDGTGTGTFTSSMTGLTPNTTYYVKAYATNSVGTAYGDEMAFTTEHEETGNYFCISARDAETSTISMEKEGDAPDVFLEYKINNNGSWTTFTVESTTINLNQNDSVFFKSPEGQPNNKFASSYGNHNYFVIQGGEVDLSGNIMYLLDPTGTKTIFDSINDNAFHCLFFNCDKIKNALQLSLPATTLAVGCYYEMFYDCTSLETAPALPAMTLAKSCYVDMFNGCTSLTTAPTLPATTLAENCYELMFENCTSLTTAPELPATNLAAYCYGQMFTGCTSLTTAPNLPATILADYCYNQMFMGCSSLVTTPEIQATTLAPSCCSDMFMDCESLTTATALHAMTMSEYCYNRMFYNCTSLTTVPALPATTLAEECYEYMFYGCTSLTTAPGLPATTLAEECYSYMFYGCTSLTTAPDLPATTLTEECYSKMFYGCSNLHSIRMLATENLNAGDALKEWVYGVSPTGNFYKKTSAVLPSGQNGIPSGWTVHNE